jgi:hypothetical protein
MPSTPKTRAEMDLDGFRELHAELIELTPEGKKPSSVETILDLEIKDGLLQINQIKKEELKQKIQDLKRFYEAIKGRFPFNNMRGAFFDYPTLMTMLSKPIINISIFPEKIADIEKQIEKINEDKSKLKPDFDIKVAAFKEAMDAAVKERMGTTTVESHRQFGNPVYGDAQDVAIKGFKEELKENTDKLNLALLKHLESLSENMKMVLINVAIMKDLLEIFGSDKSSALVKQFEEEHNKVIQLFENLYKDADTEFRSQLRAWFSNYINQMKPLEQQARIKLPLLKKEDSIVLKQFADLVLNTNRNDTEHKEIDELRQFFVEIGATNLAKEIEKKAKEKETEGQGAQKEQDKALELLGLKAQCKEKLNSVILTTRTKISPRAETSTKLWAGFKDTLKIDNPGDRAQRREDRIELIEKAIDAIKEAESSEGIVAILNELNDKTKKIGSRLYAKELDEALNGEILSRTPGLIKIAEETVHKSGAQHKRK